MKCSSCGKFSVIVDSYTPFGSYNDYEPPDEVVLCQKCVEDMEKFFIELGFMPSNWIKAKFEKRLANKLGFIEIKLRGSAWSIWHKKGQELPEDYEVLET